MPSTSSNLRQASPLAGSPVTAIHAHPISPRPVKKQKMSITQTYYLAHAARGKLSHEAARADHDLRLLVGHANLLDSLMLELHDAEREQEAWFNNAVKHSSHHASSQDPKKIRWADSIPEAETEDEADSDDSDADDYPSDDEEEFLPKTPLSAALSRSKSPLPEYDSDEEEEEEEDEDMDMEELQLSRTTSHSASPPELISDDSSDEEMDEATSPTNEPASLQIHGIKSRDFAAAASSPASKALPQQPVVVDNGTLHQPSLVAAY